MRRIALAVIGAAAGLAGCGSAHPAPKASPARPVTTSPVPTVAAPTVAVPTVAVPSTASPTTATSTSVVARLPAEGPPYPVSAGVLDLVDRSRPTVSRGVTVSASRTLVTLVWVPARPGRWPLLVFAHGFDVGPAPYLTLLRWWAAQGYVVAAPEFPLTDPDRAGPDLDENDIQQQPADVRFVVDSLVATGSSFSGSIDPKRVGVAGHSDGAETALGAAVAAPPAGEPAIRCVIAMSVSPLVGVTHTVNPPLLVTQGDADTINPPALGVQTWREASGPKYLAILHGAGHLPPLEAGSAWLSGIEALTGDFLSTYLSGTTPAASIVRAGSDPPLITTTSG